MDGRKNRDKSSYFRKDLTNLTFGDLTAIEVTGRTKHNNLIWSCKCVCGKIIEVPSGRLTQKRKINCGCRTTEIRRAAASKHGITAGGRPRTLIIWSGMKARCFNVNSISYPSYGGRGITVCEEWLSFEQFHKWAISNGYRDDYEIDRIDNDKSYEPSNCRWVPVTVNRKRQRHTRIISIYGIEKNVSEWCRELKISKSTAYKYLNKSEDDFIEFCKGQVYFMEKLLADEVA